MSRSDRHASLIDASQPSLFIAAASVLFNPVFWNVAARYEHRTHGLTRLAGNNPRRGVYVLAAAIFSLGILRDWLFQQALVRQPTMEGLASLEFKVLAGALYAYGGVMVLSSMWALGLTGTYLGDYFGILMKEKVNGFPFNVMNDPMYNGSTMLFLGLALWHESPAGILLTLLVFVCYRVALLFETPFTNNIYAAAAAKANHAE